MKTILKYFRRLLIFVSLTVLTQIGGIAYLISIPLRPVVPKSWKFAKSIAFLGLYLLLTFGVVPFLAPLFGREKINNTALLRPVNYFTVVLNRNYVSPALGEDLQLLSKQLNVKGITLQYLDANFPFLDKFPLLPHLSHNDGRKIDLALVYETTEGVITDQQKSNSGYGVFVGPLPGEVDQPKQCISQGYIQYDFPKYLTLGTKNKALQFSEQGTKLIIKEALKLSNTQKIFIEPHLKQRLGLNHAKIRYHGCRAVRHDDHIHLQTKR